LYVIPHIHARKTQQGGAAKLLVQGHIFKAGQIRAGVFARAVALIF